MNIFYLNWVASSARFISAPSSWLPIDAIHNLAGHMGHLAKACIPFFTTCTAQASYLNFNFSPITFMQNMLASIRSVSCQLDQMRGHVISKACRVYGFKIVMPSAALNSCNQGMQRHLIAKAPKRKKNMF